MGASNNVTDEFITGSFVPCGENGCCGGYISTMRDGYTFSKPCKCLLKMKQKRKQERCNIPDMYINAKFDLNEEVKAYFSIPSIENNKLIFEDTDEIDVNKFGEQYLNLQLEYFKSDPREKCKSLCIQGFTGSGKTYFASAVAMGFIDNGYNAYYIKAKQYGDIALQYSNSESIDLKAAINGNARNAKDNIYFLILDELGLENRNNENVVAEIKDLLRTRSEKLLPTIITTNKSVNDIEEMYGQEIHSMILQSYMVMSMQYGNKDYRATQNINLYKDMEWEDFLKKNQ